MVKPSIDKDEYFNVPDLLKIFKNEVKETHISFLNTEAEKTIVINEVDALLKEFTKAKGLLKDTNEKGSENDNLSEFLDWHETHTHGRELWHRLASFALNDIDPSSKGNSKLFKYLDAATEFEDLLYGLEQYYRDHTLHSLWVYLIGIKLMTESGEYEEDGKLYKYPKGELFDIGQNLNWYLFNDIKKDEDKYPYPDCLKDWATFRKDFFCKRVQEHRDSIWCIIALCHDLGYSLSKLEKLNEKVGKVLGLFHVSDFRHVGYSLNIEHQYLVSQFLELMSMDVRIGPGDNYKSLVETIEDGLGEANPSINETYKDIKDLFDEPQKKILEEIKGFKCKSYKLLKRFEEEIKESAEKAGKDLDTIIKIAKYIEEETVIKCYRDDSTYWRLCKALERKEHGILSSYLLYKTLGIFADTSVRGPAEGWGLDDEEVLYNVIRGDILFAIAQHEFAYAHIDQIGSLAEILILCDELEEFSRLGRQLQSRKYHDTAAETSIKVIPIKIGENDGVKIKLVYISKHEKKKEFYGFVTRKAERLCTLYSLNQDSGDELLIYPIKSIEVCFKWKDDDETVTFTMNKTDTDVQPKAIATLPDPDKAPYKLTEEYETQKDKMLCNEVYEDEYGKCESFEKCTTQKICRFRLGCIQCKEKCKKNTYDMECYEDELLVKPKCEHYIGYHIPLKKWVDVK